MNKRTLRLVSLVWFVPWVMEPASAEVVSSCVLKVDGFSYLKGDCPFSQKADAVTLGDDGSGTAEHSARVERQPDGTFVAKLNSLVDGSISSTDLGVVQQKGSVCWMNKRAVICATRPPAITQDSMSSETASKEETSGDVDLGQAIAGIGDTAELACLFAAEDIYAPSMRGMLRGMTSGRYTADIPKLQTFQLDQPDSVTIDGQHLAVIWHEGDTLATRVTPQVRVPDQMSGIATQQEMQEIRQVLQFMTQQSATATGLNNRVFILNFQTGTAFVATLAGSELEDQQRLRCE